jgi:hypothetical protein
VSAHTPGPWFVSEKGFSRSGLWSAPTVYAADDDLRYIAVCACADELNFHSATDNLANARLIAAAPELLAALRECADRLSVHIAHSEDLCAHMKAVEAIAKATGEDA